MRNLDHHKDMELQADKLVVANCTKTLNWWDSRLQSKLRDAVNKLRNFRTETDLAYHRQKWLVETMVHRIVDNQIRPTYSNLQTNKNRVNKLRRVANLYD